MIFRNLYSGLTIKTLFSTPARIAPDSTTLVKWSDSSGHTTFALSDDISKYELVFATMALVTDTTGNYSWSNTSVWTKNQLQNSKNAFSGYYATDGILPLGIYADSQGVAETNHYYIEAGLVINNNSGTSLKLLQYIKSGWASDAVYLEKIVGLKCL